MELPPEYPAAILPACVPRSTRKIRRPAQHPGAVAAVGVGDQRADMGACISDRELHRPALRKPGGHGAGEGTPGPVHRRTGNPLALESVAAARVYEDIDGLSGKMPAFDDNRARSELPDMTRSSLAMFGLTTSASKITKES